MDNEQGGPSPLSDILVTDEVIAYMDKRGGDFRISTSCSGPVLMPVRIRPAKSSDIPLRAGDHVIFISKYQIQWISEINMRMVPRLLFEDGDYGY
ncbi:MAG: hypothetical protein Q7J08_04465 [Methanocorpusculum sp.]|uniref:hypothetical protein n=1 Tax=Methanocorpusculum sp. TaxID=2058474 RepID=UPI00271BE214|nr:hypothetical protein [Methanocorpusculum sp.]MDO9522949.1 hypothetical protein [Methanocorpusculum sp.]